MLSLPASARWAGEYIGLPYRKCGRGRDGVDCIGLVLMVERDVFDCPLPEYDGPGFTNRREAGDLWGAWAAFAARFSTVPAGEEEEGDVVLLRLLGHPIHVGVVVARGFMLHIEEACDSVIEDYRARAWASRIVAFHRVR